MRSLDYLRALPLYENRWLTAAPVMVVATIYSVRDRLQQQWQSRIG